MAFSAWRFSGQWRRYQTLCLEAFETDCAAGRDQTLVVAPPGSGKTVVGLEVVRRLGAPAVVLCPTRTIQRQWGEKQALFGASSPDLHVLTYQSLCQTTDPEGMLREAAHRIWLEERAAATGQSVDEVVAETAAWDGQAARRRERDVARVVARGKRQVAAGKLPDIPARQLLSANAMERVQALRDAGVRVVVLDECHHLLSLWGALLKAVFELLSPQHVLGLTATNPQDVTAEEAALYAQLLDTVDFSVPTPAVVREGYLAPYQELVQLCSPLDSEQDWLAERHARFELALTRLADDGDLLGLDAWLLSRLSERLAASGGRLSWAELARRRPRLADAGLRWMHARGIPPPDDAPRGEQYRADLTIDDWVVLLEDYAIRCLRADASAEAARRLDEMQVALGDLGFALTRQGIRRVGGEVDRVLLNSAAKPLAMCDALACEYESRGQGLRAVVLCDSERPPRQAEDSPLALTGGARGLLASLGSDERFVGSRAALVTGETFAVLPGDADWWAQRLAEEAGWPEFSHGLRHEAADGLVVLRHADGRFNSQAWTAWVTRLLADGEILVLFGTRGLLGEGWDCPPVNVLVDMTAVAADVAVRQMRGRSLRLDPGDPAKLAGNWDIVCVAPQLGRGHADYSRFVRRHAHLHAPCEDGTIETGPSHVHPELSPYGPPDAGRFVAINLEQQDRAVDRDAARGRWRIGEPYRGVDLDVLVVRNPRRVGEQPQVALADVRPLRSRWQTRERRRRPRGCRRRGRDGRGAGRPGAARRRRPRAPGGRRGARVGEARRAPGASCGASAGVGGGRGLRRVRRAGGDDGRGGPDDVVHRPAGGLGAGQPAGCGRRGQPPRHRGARRALRRRRAGALRRLPQGRPRRAYRLASGPGGPGAPQGSRPGVPRRVAALDGRRRARLLPRRRRARHGPGGAGVPRPRPRDAAPADLALGRAHAQRSSADRKGCAAWLFSSSCSRPPCAAAGTRSPCRIWPPTIRGSRRGSAGLQLPGRVRGNFLELSTADKGFQPRFWPGVNLGSTVPGRFPGELAQTRADYRRWLPQMAALGTRALRVYTILPPSFYEELRRYNLAHPAAPVYVIHGAWIPEDRFMETGNAYDPEVQREFTQELTDVVSVVHGDADLPKRRGHGSGRYRADISQWLLAWSIGVEWDPLAVRRTLKLNPNVPAYQGRYITTSGKPNAMESWIASHLDHVARLEAKRGWSRPITFTNWLTADPLRHPSEPSIQEDLVSIDAMQMRATPRWPAGFFASYHVYPYYPEFLRPREELPDLQAP